VPFAERNGLNHAVVRAGQGRNVNTVISDIQKARPSDVFIQEDGRWVIRGSNGRAHILEPNGEIVTSFSGVSTTNVQHRIKTGR